MTTVRQLSFAGGELSPSLQGRVDLVKYATGARILRNRYVRRDGGTDNRAGTSFVSEVKNSNTEVRTIPFQFSLGLDQTYVLEFGNGYIRFIKHGAPILQTGKVITGITQDAQAVFSSVSHGFNDLDEVYLSEIVGPDELNGRNVIISNKTTSTFKAKYRDGTYVDTTAMAAYASGGLAARVYEISTTYAEADLYRIDYAQSADVVTLALHEYPVRELSRLGETNWAISNSSFVPSISAPSGFSGSGGTFNSYIVTAVKDESFEESLQSAIYRTGTLLPAPDAQLTFSWNSVSGARYYRVYRIVNGVPGFVNTAASTSGTVTFTDIGVTPDTTDTPPDARNPFNAPNNYPAVVALIGQRRFFANMLSDSERIDGSRIGQYRNFTISTPLKDDSALTFRIAGDRVNPVTHLLNLKGLLTMTEEGEIAVGARDSGALTPFSLHQEQNSYNGSNHIKPILSGNRAIYVQRNGRQIFDFGFDVIEDTYKPGDLTAFSSHLFEKYQVVDWAYQKTPNSIIWVVRSDGALLSLTYVKEQDITAWARHDLDGGFVENACCIAEDDETFLYLIVKRTVDGRVVRYHERLNTRVILDERDMIFMDSAITYDGRNADDAHTMRIANGTSWEAGEYLSIFSSDPYFDADEVGNTIQMFDGDNRVDFDIEEYVSAVEMRGRCTKDVPTALRNIDSNVWVRAVDEVIGLWHIEGKNVSVLGDGGVVKSPYNPQYNPVLTVTDGRVVFDHTYGVLQIGLPITSDLQTLDIDTAQGETMIDKKKQVGKLTVRLNESRGGYAGSQFPEDGESILQGFYELQRRDAEEYGQTPELFTGTLEDEIERSWTPGGSIIIRQTEPLPLSILSIAPAGMMPLGG